MTERDGRSFAEILAAHKGKVLHKWQSYIPVYESLLAEFRDKRTALLEIGIQNGGSLETYSEYFSNPEIIVGCDIDPKCRLLRYRPGTQVVIGDCIKEETRREITALSPSFDIIIDDGSHVSKDIIVAFLQYFPLVRPGGVYVIEDLHASYWQQWQGGLFHKKSSIAFLKLLVDVVHAEHWGIHENVSDFMATEFPEFRPMFNQQFARDIKSISFMNSMCIIRKSENDAPNSLGRHVVRGSEAVVEQSILALDNARPANPDERQNPSSSFLYREGKANGVTFSDQLKNNKPTIAAIMPVYNGERFLRESIQSVLDQTLFPHEFFIIDDGSTDRSHAIIDEMCSKYPITFIKKEKNSGQSASRNFGVKQCKSDLIALIDQDDRWYPNHLEELAKPFQERSGGLPLGWAYSDFDDIDESGLIIARSFVNRPTIQNPKRDLVQFLVQGAVTQPSATLISRAAFEAVGGFDENLSGFEDEDLFLRMFRANFDNVYIPQPHSQWRIYDTSSGASSRQERSQRYFFSKLTEMFPDDKWRGNYYVRDLIAPRFVMIWAYMYLRAGRYKNYKKMREYAWDIWALIPHLRLHRRVKLGLAFPVLLWPRAGELLLKIAARYQRFIRF